jgi:hypothetical protein
MEICTAQTQDHTKWSIPNCQIHMNTEDTCQFFLTYPTSQYMEIHSVVLMLLHLRQALWISHKKALKIMFFKSSWSLESVLISMVIH